MGDSIRSKLSTAFAPLLAPIFDEPTIIETRATCDDCAMCDKRSGDERPGDEFFEPALKCCTYHPVLPNFLVGGLFADPAPELEEGKRRLRQKIAGRVGVTPNAVAAPRMTRVIYAAARERGFGRAPILQCPYLDEGRCSIWRYREAVCSTYYCKHVGGAKGRAFWMTLKVYLQSLEASLATWAAHEIHPGAAEPKTPALELTVEDVEGLPPSPSDYQSYWGDWVDREEEFYVACDAKVRGLTRDDIVRLFDATPKGKDLLGQLGKRYEELARPQPSRYLVVNPGMRRLPMADGVAVRTYSPYDPMFLTTDLDELIGQFGQDEPVAATLARLEVELPEDLVRDLWMHEILVPPSNECRSGARLKPLKPRCAAMPKKD